MPKIMGVDFDKYEKGEKSWALNKLQIWTLMKKEEKKGNWPKYRLEVV